MKETRGLPLSPRHNNDRRKMPSAGYRRRSSHGRRQVWAGAFAPVFINRFYPSAMAATRGSPPTTTTAS